MRTAIGFAVIGLCALSPAAMAGEPDAGMIEHGAGLVADYCETCHATGEAGSSPHEQAPPFRELHLRYDVEWLSEALVEGLVSGHPDMPEFEFDPEQAAAIIAYLKSLE